MHIEFAILTRIEDNSFIYFRIKIYLKDDILQFSYQVLHAVHRFVNLMADITVHVCLAFYLKTPTNSTK